MSGPLQSGEFIFRATHNKTHCESKLDFKPTYLAAASNISAAREGDYIEITWNPSPSSDSFLIGLMPISGKFPDDFFTISHPDHRGNKLRLRHDLFPKGTFWVLVRSNQHLPYGTDVGYIRESWGSSKAPFNN
jgi:hypothetical protein